MCDTDDVVNKTRLKRTQKEMAKDIRVTLKLIKAVNILTMLRKKYKSKARQ